MKKFLKISLLIIVVAFIAIQFINRPDKSTVSDITGDDITKKLAVPANVQDIFKRSCYDCHSSMTVWPWYSQVAPVSWLVGDDVVKGRKKMNFNEWGKLSAAKQEKRLADICDEISEDKMPLDNYLLIHKDAKLTKADKDAICGWIKSMGIETGGDDKKDDKK